MNAVKKSLAVLLALVLCVGMLALPAYAAEVAQDGLEVTLTTDKDVYEQGETIVATLTVKNTNDVAAINVSLESLVPEGYLLEDGNENMMQVETLAVGESVTLTVCFVAEEIEEPTEEPTEKPTEDDSPNTGDDSALGLWMMLTAAAVMGLIVLAVKSKLWKQMISLVLCIAMVASMFAGLSFQANATETEDKTIDVVTTVQVGDEQVEVKAKVAYQLMEDEKPTEPGVTTYTVTFESNGGSKVEAQIVEAGMVAIEPTAPVLEGYSFVGWYSDEALTVAYDFSQPVASDLTLYACWEVDTITEEEMNVDQDDDGLSDGAEEFLGTDNTKEDTDDDGLSDVVEVVIGSNPTDPDSDDDGILDCDEDADNDGLTNLDEINRGTDPGEDDSDHDDLNDYEEIFTYNTQPLNTDTDADGAKDGWEVRHGYDPLVADDSFDISRSSSTEDITATANLKVSGNQVGTLIVEEAERHFLLDDTIPGYIGAAFDFRVEGDFDEAIISFAFDASLLSDPSFVPVIYYYNEETQCLEELDTVQNGNVASTTVTHFSTYILLNKTAFDQVWSNEIKPPIASGDGTSSNIDVVFVIDCSGSMSSYQRMSTAKSALHTFIGALGENDRAALVKFTSSASILSGLTTDKASVDAMVDSLSASGQTAMYKGLEKGIELLSDSTEKYGYKMIIVLSDGRDEPSTTYDGYYASLVENAVSKDIVVYTIGAGTSVDTSILTQVAQNTGGAYYAATVTSGITDAFDEIKGDTVDLTTDSNNDSIPDYFTELLCNGSLKLGTGKNNPFFCAGTSFEDLQADTDGDFDNDGLLNGQELIVKYIESLNRVYVWLMSDPTSCDSDYDGIDDINEESQEASHNNQFKADVYHISGGSTYHFDAEFVVDYSLFFGDNTKFNQNLAVLASLYALDMYEEKTVGKDESYGYLTITSGTSGTTKGSNGAAFGEIFGLNDCVTIDETELATTYAEPNSKGILVDQDDVAEAFFGHRLVSYQGEQREVIFLTVRGTNGTQAEWSSNFDIGADLAAYYEKTGEHPDWKNKENHKGFDVAATRILKAFDAYIKDLENSGKMDTSIKRSIFITGHSRGAGIANLLGAYFEDHPSYDSFVYTMASPYTTTRPEAVSAYQTIFNIRNEDDLVTYLPLKDWGFYKYGTTLSVSIENDGYEDTSMIGNAEGTFEALFGDDYNSNSYVDDCETAFYAMSKGRSDFYVLDYTSGDGQILEGALHFFDSAFTEFDELIKAAKMDKYSDYSKNNKKIGYTIDVTYCPAYAAQNIANPASGNDIANNSVIADNYDGDGLAVTLDMLGIDLKGVYSTARTKFVLASGKLQLWGAGPGGMEHPHIPGTYYLITSNTAFDDYEQ